MLNEDQKNVLTLLRDLSRSALSLSEQVGYVTLINEAILKLEDEVEEARLLDMVSSEDESFVKLARRRLVEAQQAASNRFSERRLAKVAKQSSNDTDLNADPIRAALDHPPAESEEDMARGVRETKSESITKVLQRMHDLAQAEILKGELNISELDMSSKTLRELQEKYSGVDMLLNGSKRLVKILDEADKWDRRCMQASLGFLAAVLVYIIYRRILSGPLKILLWSVFQFVGLVRWVVPTQKVPQAVPQQGLAATHAQNSIAGMMSPTIVVEPTASLFAEPVFTDQGATKEIEISESSSAEEAAYARTSTIVQAHSEQSEYIQHAEL